MKGRDILKGMVDSTEPTKLNAPTGVPPHKPAGAVRAMNLSLGRLNEQAAVARELREAIAAGDKVIDLDPALIDSAFIQDRIPLESDPDFEALVASVRESGQQVPILVRPHPSQEDRYQAAYGHRRLRAAATLGRPVKAVVRTLSDEEVILAQGQENGPRVDLSFIERALFARRMETHGIERGTIAAALTVDKPEISRLLQVAEGVGQELILLIGPAPKVGRPRWLGFVDRLKDSATAKRIMAEAQAPDFRSANTNDRFNRLWRVAKEPAEQRGKKIDIIRTKKGLQLASFEHGQHTSKIALTSKEFAKFLSNRMSDLVREFERESSEKTNR